jgi:hypothetical protein
MNFIGTWKIDKKRTTGLKECLKALRYDKMIITAIVKTKIKLIITIDESSKLMSIKTKTRFKNETVIHYLDGKTHNILETDKLDSAIIGTEKLSLINDKILKYEATMNDGMKYVDSRVLSDDYNTCTQTTEITFPKGKNDSHELTKKTGLITFIRLN